MPKTSYPDTSIHDDWNDRTPQPVTSLADDVERAGNTPNPQLGKELPKDYVETSLGAVLPNTEVAEAAKDVSMKNPETIGRDALAADADSDDEGDDEGPFDPSGASVAEVNAYLDGELTDAERTRVLDAERAGKNRSTVNGL